MESDLNNSFGIYWDLNTCHSNDIKLMAQKIRETYVKNSNEREFLCSTVKGIDNQTELKDNYGINIVYSSKIIDLNNFLKSRIRQHVNESIIYELRPIVILITGDNSLAQVLHSIKNCAEIVLIYGQDLKQDLVQMANKYFPFIDLELNVLNMTNIQLFSRIKLNESIDNDNERKGIKCYFH